MSFYVFCMYQFIQISNFIMEPLIEVEQSKWPELRDLYKVNWPDGVVAFCLLDTLISHPDFIPTFCFKLFAPDGNISNGFLATSYEGTKCTVMIHPLKTVASMEKALIDTKKIIWEEVVYVASASPPVEECLKKLEKLFGIKIQTKGNKALKHLLDRNSKPFDISNPPNTYVAELRPEHLDIVNETWTFYSESSIKFFEALTKNHLTYVLYSTKDDSPLAWVTISYEGSLTHLYCLEDYRRKGYAEYILKFAANDQVIKGKNVLGYTVEKNINAQKLFDKLNFERIGFDTWLYITKD